MANDAMNALLRSRGRSEPSDSMSDARTRLVAERGRALGVGDAEIVAKLIDWGDHGQTLDSAIKGVLASHPRLRVSTGSADGGTGGSELVAEIDPNMQLREAALGARYRS